MAETPTRNADIDLASLIKPKAAPATSSTEEKPEAPVEEPVKKKTPVEELLEKRQNGGMGMVVSNKEMAEGERKSVKSHVDNEERMENYRNTLDDMDKSIISQRYLVMKHKPYGEIETAEMMAELDSFDPEQLRKMQEDHPEGAVLRSKYFNLQSKELTETLPLQKPKIQLTEEDKKKFHVEDITEMIPKIPEGEKRPVSKHVQKEEPKHEIANVADEVEQDNEALDIVSEDEQEEIERQEKREKLVKVLIDKTNLGQPVEFNETEAEDIRRATRLDIVEVENVELSSVKTVKPKKSFLESIKEHKSAGVNVPMTFPCSRFRATMSGLTYGEIGDLALNSQTQDYDPTIAILTTVYNKMHNCSFGGFKSFDDFLDGFAWNDVELAIYGLYIASSAEKDAILLNCGNQTCKKSFNISYRPRSILLFDECGDAFLKYAKEVVDVNGAEAKELYNHAPHKNEKVFKMPNSGWYAHIAYATCRDYLDTIISNANIEEFRKTHPEDINGVKQTNILLLQMIRAISIPNDQGEYERYDSLEDILEALYLMNGEDYQILLQMIGKYMTDYNIVFGIKDIVCPHCGTKTELLSLDIANLVFRQYQRLNNTSVNLKKLEDL